MTLDQFIPGNAWSLLLVFARLGAALMVLPGFGEIFVLPRARLLLAIALTVIVAPLVAPGLPALPDSPLRLFLILAGEMVVGLFLGTLVRVMISALHVAGTIVGFQSSLANATLFDPSEATQGSMIGTFLGMLGIVLVFVADLHHQMLSAIVDSYTVFRPGEALPWGDFTATISSLLAHAFALGMQLSAPFLVVGLVFYLGLGLVNRLMPQVQIFFIAMPLQIGLAFFVMSITLSATLLWFLQDFQGGLGALVR
jgi:flagellar biosynthesis protein FliR